MERLLRFFLSRPLKVNQDINVSELNLIESATTHVERSAYELMCEAILDPVFYLETYPDIASAGVAPLQHYIEAGHREGRWPLSIYASDAPKKVEKALEYAPSDSLILAYHVYFELLSDDIERVVSASNINVESYIDTNLRPFLLAPYEQASTLILGRWLRYESLQCINEVESTISNFRKHFPSSPTLAALNAIALFENGKLKSARQIFSTITNKDAIHDEILGICEKSILQAQEAETINTKDPSNSKILFLDSAFPSKISSFRYGEFSEYLSAFDQSSIHIKSDANLLRFGESSSLAEQIKAFCEENTIETHRIRRYDYDNTGTPKVAYCVFLSLADLFFSQIGVPSAEHLVFTLYPGGGFAPNNERSDFALRRLCNNPKVSKIITTQITSYKYLTENGFCEPDRILHIFGGIIPELYTRTERPARKASTAAINVCFVAQRYSATGAEKGYDVFADIIKKFSNSPSINFHIVGGFDASVIDLGNPQNVKFYGTQPASFFPEFYASMDAILSPNIQHCAIDPSYPAIFDGFPTTCVVEAGLQGAAMFLTDFQEMNQRLDGSPIFTSDEVEIIDRDCETICEKLEHYIKDREGLYQLGQAGRNAILREFSYERQITPRIELLKNLIDS